VLRKDESKKDVKLEQHKEGIGAMWGTKKTMKGSDIILG